MTNFPFPCDGASARRQAYVSRIMNTAFMLMAQYDGRSIIPVEDVCRDYFSHLTREKFLRKPATGEIELPPVRIEESQKSAKCIHVTDLAAYLDMRREKALGKQCALRS